MGHHQQLSGVFLGEGSLLIQCAELFLSNGHQITAIVSSEPMIVRWSAEKDIPHLLPTDDVCAALTAGSFDYLFSIVNLTLLPEAVIKLPRRLAINFHDSALPTYAGLNATSWAILRQEQTHGVTWHEMTDTVDTGRILKQHPIEISADETAFSLNTKCYDAGIRSFGELLEDLTNDCPTFGDPQLEGRTYFGKFARPSAAGTIPWDGRAADISALVRALDFGRYPNPLGRAKVYLDDTALIVSDITVLDTTSPAPPGTILDAPADALTVTTSSQDVVLRGLRTIEGQALSTLEPKVRLALQPGQTLPRICPELLTRLDALNGEICRHEAFWVKRLASPRPVELPYAQRSGTPGAASEYASMPFQPPAGLAALAVPADVRPVVADIVVAAFALYLARLSGQSDFDLGIGGAQPKCDLSGLEHYVATQVPLRIGIDDQQPGRQVLEGIGTEIERVRRHWTYARDVVTRFPELQPLLARGGRPSYPIAVEIRDDVQTFRPAAGTELALVVSLDATAARWVYDSTVYSLENVAAMQGQLVDFLRRAVATDAPIATVALLPDDERARVLAEWNSTQTPYAHRACIHHLVEAQADRTPDAVALAFEDQQITYRELDQRANQVARHLQALGVGPDVLVGLCMERSIELIVALLGVHKAGAAYVPLDPTYPRDRLAFMVEDSQLRVLLTTKQTAGHLPPHSAERVCLDADWETIAERPADRPTSPVTSENLAYVIYTSGSTGKPKGVMVTHRNVVNFFAGMDERLGGDTPGVWLAVTSLSFDISVLEILWPLTHGFKVVIQGDRAKPGSTTPARRPTITRNIDFSLFYFASDEGESVADKYRLLLEGARFADQHGFAAVWTPERHFHAFGGLYPNPSVASAALAAITERVKIRAGSVVLPLHSPIRVAEEWALVDNLSNGRVGISFAAGWQPNDFAIAPASFQDRKQVMLRQIDTVRKLWRGEGVAFPGPTGADIEVHTLPRPVQSELPVWLTAAGSPETFRMAGEIGAGLLTHLLGQSLEALADKLAIYRRAWRESGHAGDGHVTLMLHTFVGDDESSVRETVREPMKAYLRSSVELIKDAAWTFPAFATRLQNGANGQPDAFDTGALTDEELDALLDHAFERYFKSSGLFGTPQACLEMVERLTKLGVDEIACLIDFGVPSTTALEHLEHLKALMELSRPVVETGDHSIPAQIDRHAVTHLQCTPSMASMLAMDERTSAALRHLKYLMIGGEAFPLPLAARLKDLVAGDVLNMYGPTETTIWSSTYHLDQTGGSIPIGRPIANTQLYVLDAHAQPVPIGVPGELFIGGDGVVRGYLHRPELTAERFIQDPFSRRPGARLYRTGDLVRYRSDGNVEFLGRLDHQVKVRGYRIEMGEIETVLQEQPSVKQAVVMAREDIAGDVRLVAYVVPAGSLPAVADLRGALKETLPEFMVPAHIVFLDALPLTPNAKVDRKALPAPERALTGAPAAFDPPRSSLETTIAGIWCDALSVEQVGVADNFFDLGGHSLLMVQVQHTLRRSLDRDIPITDLFRFPTVRSLAAHLNQPIDHPTTMHQSAERADTRRDLRDAMMRRRQLRQPAVR
jgi:natural product biosynthesis luciferase-like monooxygenase protein